MDKIRVYIAVIEPSDMVYQGLSTLLMKAGHDYFFYRLNDLEEISTMFSRVNFSMAIINPGIIQNRVNEFVRLKKQYPDICWMGLVYAFFSNTVLNKFDKTFSIHEETETIIRIINNAFYRSKNGVDENQELSEREMDVLRMLAKGLSNKEIADKLHISIHTVISHRKNLVEKTGIKSLPGLTIYAISQNIISLDQSGE